MVRKRTDFSYFGTEVRSPKLLVPDQTDILHRVGEYYADYSELPTSEINAPDPASEELFKKSKIISVKR